MRAFTNFVYGVALLMMVPIGTSAETHQDKDKSQLIEAAKDSFADVDYVCKQHPKVCESAADFALDLQHRAKAGLSYFNLWTADLTPAPGSVHRPIALAAADPATISDLRPPLFE